MLSQAERERTERLADSYILQTHPADHAAWIADVDMTPEVGARAKWVTVGARLASVQKKALLGGAHVLKMQDDGMLGLYDGVSLQRQSFAPHLVKRHRW